MGYDRVRSVPSVRVRPRDVSAPPVRRALRVGAADDAAEIEADRLAASVTARLGNPSNGSEGPMPDTELGRVRRAPIPDGDVQREPAEDLAAEAEFQAAKAMAQVELDLVVSMLGNASNLLMVQLPLLQRAIVEPSLFGAASATGSMITPFLDTAHRALTGLRRSWGKVAPRVAAGPLAPMVTAFETQLDTLDHQVEQWKMLAHALVPGNMGLAGQLLGEFNTGRFTLQALGAPLLGSSAGPPRGAAPPVAPRVAPAPVAPPVAAPAIAVPPPIPAAPVVEPAPGPEAPEVVPVAPPRPLKDYKNLKSRGDYYQDEDTVGSKDLPQIFKAAETLVNRGKIPSVGAYMIKHFGWSQSDVDKYVTNKEKATVKYLDENERKAFELHGGSTLTQGDSRDPFDTSAMFSKHSGKGFGIYVMSADGALYADQHKVGLFHHSSFLKGGTVAGAGELRVENGTVKEVTNKTGHYRAGPEELWQVIDSLKGRGASLGGVKVVLVGESQPYPGGAEAFHREQKPANA